MEKTETMETMEKKEKYDEKKVYPKCIQAYKSGT